MRNNLLYRVRCVGDGDSPEMQQQLVIPSTARQCILEQLHDKAGHLGQDHTMALLRPRCFWPGMASDMREHVRDCARCVRRKHPVNQVAPLQNVFTTQPMELVCMDYLTLETSKDGFENILVVTDHFTKYSQAYPTSIPWICYERSFSELYLSIWNQLVFNQRLQLFVQSPQPYLLIFAWRN